NIAGFGTFLRNTCDDVTNVDLVAVVDTQDRLGRQHVVSWHIGVGQEQLLAFLIDQSHRRTQILTGRRTLSRVQHLNRTQTCQLICLTTDGQTVFHTGEGNGTRHFRDDRVSVGVPLGHYLATFHRLAIFYADHSAIGNLVAF